MTTLTNTLALPDEMAHADMYAGAEYGRRVVAWTLRDPGSWYRCTYSIAWLTVTEREAWRGEPLSLTTQRRIGDNTERVPFTDKARQAIAADLLPRIARYGFDRLWLEGHRAREGDGSGSLARSAEARREAAWWEMQAVLAQMHADGLLTFRPLPQADGYGREQRVRVVPAYRGGSGTEPVTARVVGPDGDEIGWVTTGYSLAPNASILEP